MFSIIIKDKTVIEEEFSACRASTKFINAS